MTYKKLLIKLNQLSKEQLNTDVSILNTLIDEYYPAKRLNITKRTDVLDKNHPVIEF